MLNPIYLISKKPMLLVVWFNWSGPCSGGKDGHLVGMVGVVGGRVVGVVRVDGEVWSKSAVGLMDLHL